MQGLPLAGNASRMSDLTLLDLLHRWGAERPGRVAYRFLQSDESIDEEVTYAALRGTSLAIARALASGVPAGSRALLLFETGPGFVHAFFGCLAAGVLAVPADPPHGRRAWGGIDRIVGDCRPAIILTTRVLKQRWESPLADLAAAHGCRVVTIDDLLAGGGGEADLPAVTGDDVAFLQYTSGSTSHPKGVIVTHANIIANVRMIQAAFELDADTQTVSWLPLFHDMGLIGFVLVPFYLGCTSTILSPAAFLERPVRWLRAIDRYRGTITSAPNFAYDLCCAKIRDEDLDGLDLSCLVNALNGSEPVSARTLRAFEERFARIGFGPRAFRPCYGMAESTLFISTIEPGDRYRVLPASRTAPGDAQAGEGMDVAEFRIESPEVVGCGHARQGAEIRIANPVTGTECAEGRVGEVWFRGGNVAAGYWDNAAATAAAFRARIAGRDDGGGYLRTGDLGRMDRGELFLMGRMKELLIIRGRNFPPRDIEEAVAGAHVALRTGHVVAAGVAHDAGQELGIAAEIDREHWRTFDAQAVTDAILDVLSAEFALGPEVVTLLRPGALPKTTSGKLKRLECARRLSSADHAAEWTVLHEWRRPSQAGTTAAAVELPSVTGFDAAVLTDVVLTWLRARLAQALECAPSQIADEEPFARFGLDSAIAVTLTGELGAWLQLDLDPTIFWEFSHPLALAEHLAGVLAARNLAGAPVEHA
jgi:acyl-CoA synthetase (AMP-forming)/AMP-acid ligase II